MKYWLYLLLILLNTSISNAATDSDFESMEVTITPRPHKDLTGYPIGLSDSYYFIKSANRIFFQDKAINAKIVDADISSNKAEFTIKNGKYGEGTLQIFSEKSLKETDSGELKQAILGSLSDGNISLVVADSATKTYHISTCNHLPPETSRIYLGKSAADSSGYKGCGVCFYDQLYLPDYATEMSIQNKGAAELRHYNQHLSDPGLQARLHGIGKRVLAGWPYPLLGYNYQFSVVESREINAFALAAGSIFVTTGLLKATENDDELEAVIAHEIAHVERRHGLQSYHKMVSDHQAQLALQVIGGIAAGVAVANNRPGAASAIGGVTLASILAVKLQHMGYSREHEKEADDFAVRYFVKSGKSLEPLKSVFKKLMYHNLCSRFVPDPANSSHPALGSRIASLVESKHYFTTGQYHLVYKEKPLELRFLTTSTNKEGSQLVLFVSDFAVFKELLNTSDTMKFNSGSKTYDLVIESNYISTDPWGGMVTARSAVELSTLPQFDTVGSTVYVNMSNGNLSTMTDPNAYPDNRVYQLLKGPYY